MTLPRRPPSSAASTTTPPCSSSINVWDVISATVVADLPGCEALATASHSIAASLGYPDGEQIPRDLMISAVGQIAAAVELPVTADLEAGYGDAAETVRRAIAVGIVGANLEDQMKPFDDAVAAVEAAVSAGLPRGSTSSSTRGRTPISRRATVTRRPCSPTPSPGGAPSSTSARRASSSPA